jgi:hypothetical protein
MSTEPCKTRAERSRPKAPARKNRRGGENLGKDLTRRPQRKKVSAEDAPGA